MPNRTFRALGAALLLMAGVLPSAAAQTAPLAGSQAPLLPGDAIVVRVVGDSSLRDTLFVEWDGQVALPRVGRVNVSTTSAGELPSLIRRALGAVARPEDIGVRPLRRVTVVGEILKPGVFFLDPVTTLRDAVALAGAFSPVADPRRIGLDRRGTQSQLVDWQLSPEASAPVASGDVIAVPREGWLRRNALNVSSSVLLVVTTFLAATRR